MTKAPRLGICGAFGRMGKALQDEAKSTCLEIVEYIDRSDRLQAHEHDVKCFDKPADKADVYLDFTAPTVCGTNVSVCAKIGKPVVVGTTGLTSEDEEEILRASQKVAVVRDSNMSLGITVFRDLITSCKYLRSTGYDVEIVEQHHRCKLDAPSGTALSLLKIFDGAVPIHGRFGIRSRQDNEIGVHSVRAGGTYGIHSVFFSSPDETIELKHSLISRGALASGALKAALFASQAKPGLYSMVDVWHWLKTAK